MALSAEDNDRLRQMQAYRKLRDEEMGYQRTETWTCRRGENVISIEPLDTDSVEPRIYISVGMRVGDEIKYANFDLKEGRDDLIRLIHMMERALKLNC